MKKTPCWLVFLALFVPQVLKASSIYCYWDEKRGEFLVVADTRVRCFDHKTGRTVKYEVTQKWCELPNGALFVATGKYVEDKAKGRNILAIARETVTPGMTYEEAAEAISAANIKHGLLAMRNNRDNLFEGCLLGFDQGVPKMTYLRFPPAELLPNPATPYYQVNRLAERAFPLGIGMLRNGGQDLFLKRDKKAFLLNAMRRQIAAAPEVVGAPIDVLTMRKGHGLEYQRVE